MTPERKNEIWVMLTDKERAEFISEFNDNAIDRSFNNGYNMALLSVFGSNLTAQAEEKPKEESNDIPYGNRVVTPFGEGVVGMDINGHKCVKLDAGGCADMEKAIILTDSFQSCIDWNKYRLDLAKEIAMAMIRNSYMTDSVSADAVCIANEIVKRLKETEI